MERLIVHKGVTFDSSRNRWLAKNKDPTTGKTKQIGSFYTEVEAITAITEFCSKLNIDTNVDDLDGEVWLQIPDWESLYLVSNLGRVKSLDRFYVRSNGQSVVLIGRVLKPGVNRGGYEYVNLKDGKRTKSARVHSLVALCFLNHVSGIQQVVDHIDGNKRNNNVSNLQIISHRSNTTKGNLCKNKKHSNMIGVPKSRKKWRSQIKINYESLTLGTFEIEADAGEAYQTALSKYIKNKVYYDTEIMEYSKKDKVKYLLS